MPSKSGVAVFNDGHRKIAGRMEHQNSSGCRECSNGHNFLLVAGRSARCSGGPATVVGTRSAAGRSSAGDGPGLRERRNPATGAEIEHDPGRTAPVKPTLTLGYDRELYKKRNQVERLFRRLKGFRRIFSRFEKLDGVFLAFIYFAFIIEALRSCEHGLIDHS